MIMVRLAWAEVRRHPTRYVATLAATALGVGFVVALLVFVPTQIRSIGARASAQTSAADVAVTGLEDRDHTLAARVRTLPGVAVAEPRYTAWTAFTAGGRAGQLELSSLPTDPRLRWFGLAAGDWPTGPDQIVVSGSTARAYGLTVGSKLITAVTSARPPIGLQIVGISADGRSLFDDQASGAVPMAVFEQAAAGAKDPADDPRAYPTVLVLAADGTSPEQLRDTLRTRLSPDADVRTSAEIAADNLDQLSGGVQAGDLLLLVFGPIALLVGAMIITNTQLLVLTQRRRQLALLRVVGAGRGQLRRSLITETLLVGLVGSVAGVVLGLGLAAGLSALSDSLEAGLVVPVGQLLAAVGVGLVVGLTASLVPTWRATRVAPVEALQPVADAAEDRRVGRIRIMIAGLLLLGGGGAVAIAVWHGHAFPVTVGGCALLALGILLLAPTYVPPLLRALGAVVGRTGPTARLAAANLAQHPRRTAATATALMLAVGLIVTLQVGAASVKASVQAEVARRFPVEVTVDSSTGAIGPAVRSAVAAVPGVVAVEPVATTDATVGAGSARSEVTVIGLAPSAARVVGGGFEALQPGVALAHPFTLKSISAHAGETVRLRAGNRHMDVRLVESDLADAGQLAVPQANLDRLAPGARVRTLWVKTDHSDPTRLVADITRASAGQLGLAVHGSLVQAAEVGSAVDATLLVATGLLAVAVLIALVGVGATISLSVVERTRESALLRALGLQRRQLRGMLAVEAGLLAVAATVVGVIAGIGFGVIGTAGLVDAVGATELRLAVSVPQTLLVIGVALAAGLLASVLPGRRAARTDPAAVLADD